MKTRVNLLSLFLALAGMTNAQTSWNLGFANRDVACIGPNGGVQITNPATNQGHAGLFLDNQMNGGHRYSWSSIGVWPGLTAGDFSLYDWTTQTEVMHVLGSNANIGIGTLNPSEQLHTMAGVRFQGLTTAPGNYPGVTIDGNGKLWIGSGGLTNGCTSTNFVVKNTSSGNLTCSQIFDNGSGVGINNSTGSFGFNYQAGSWLLQGNPFQTNVSGNFRLMVGGYSESTGFYASSDERYKKDIKPINNALTIINKLEGKTYSWRTEEFKDKGFTLAPQIGFIAQELEKVIPEVVVTKDDGYKSVSYDMIIPILAQGIKEQQAIIDNQTKTNIELRSLIEELQKQVSQISGNKTSNPTNINLLNPAAEGFALEQNIPNPFSQETIINYTLPQQVKNASLIVYDLSGKQLTSFPLELNSQSITITAEKLSAGIYIYNLVADGKIMDSKRMVVTNKQ